MLYTLTIPIPALIIIMLFTITGIFTFLKAISNI